MNEQKASVVWTGAEQLVGVTPSGHALVIDAAQVKVAPGPMELLLVALGGCTATDVVGILKKKRQDLRGLVVEITGERAAAPPRVWAKLHVRYRLRGRQLDPKAVVDAIQLSESKYCSVAAMLRKSAEITFEHIIEEDC